MLIQSIFNYKSITNLKNDSSINDDKSTMNNFIVRKEPFQSNFDMYKIYAQTMPNFKSRIVNSTNFELILTDEQKPPRIKIEFNKNNNFNTKQGIYPVYQMALNDQMYEELSKNPDIINKESYILPESRKLDIRCSQEDLPKVLTMIQDKFIDLKISPKYFNTAKSLAPVLFELDRVTGKFSPEFSDIPKDMKNSEYVNLINNISYQDILNYNNDFLNNSDKNIQLFVNKNFYNEHKQEITEITNKWI